jgi:hypothetical protein
MPGDSNPQSPPQSQPDVQPPFWLPSKSRAAAQFGFRWLFLLIVFFPAAGAALVVHAHWHSVGAFIVSAAICLAMTIPVAISYAVKLSLKKIPHPFCIHCGHDLTGLPDNTTCPHCHRPFSLNQIDQYRLDPGSFIYR